MDCLNIINFKVMSQPVFHEKHFPVDRRSKHSLGVFLFISFEMYFHDPDARRKFSRVHIHLFILEDWNSPHSGRAG